MLDILNGFEEMPAYFTQNRLMLFSKTNSPNVSLDQMRPISIASHIVKVYEKAIKKKIEEIGSNLLTTEAYQSGF